MSRTPRRAYSAIHIDSSWNKVLSGIRPMHSYICWDVVGMRGASVELALVHIRMIRGGTNLC